MYSSNKYNYYDDVGGQYIEDKSQLMIHVDDNWQWSLVCRVDVR